MPRPCTSRSVKRARARELGLDPSVAGNDAPASEGIAASVPVKRVRKPRKR
jgi:hypothetical protein